MPEVLPIPGDRPLDPLARIFAFAFVTLALAALPAAAQAPVLALALASPLQVDPPDGFDPVGEATRSARRALDEGRPGEALDLIEEVSGLLPIDFDLGLLGLRAEALNDLGRFAEALELFDSVSSANRGRGIALRLEEVRSLRGAGQWRDALARLQQILEAYPRCGPARVALIDILVEQEQDARAQSELKRLLNQSPGLVWAVALKARLESRAGNTQAAIEQLRSNLDQDDASGTLRVVLVEVLLEGDRGREAWIEAQPLIEAGRSAAQLELGALAARAAGEPLDAFRALVLALRIEPGRPASLDLLIDVLERADDLRDDIALERARSAPLEPSGWERVVRGRLRAGRVAAAVELYEGLPSEVRADPELRLAAAEALRRSGRLDDAMAAVEALCIDPPSAAPTAPRAWYERAQIEYERREYERAVGSFEKAAEGPWRAEALYNRGLLLREMERAQEAARAFEAAVEARPGLSEAWLALGDLRRGALGDRLGAVEAYRNYLSQVGGDPRIEALVEELDR